MPATETGRMLAWYRGWLADRDRVPDTFIAYRRTLLRFWSFAGKDPSRCTQRDLHRFLARAPQGRTGRLADSYRATDAARVLAFYHAAALGRQLRRDPMAGFPRPRSHLGPPRSLPLADIGRLLAWSYSRPRTWLTLWLAYSTGARIAELASLRIEDCDLGDLPSIRVHGKGRRDRVIPLTPMATRVLAMALDGRPGVGPVLEHALVPGRPVSAKTVGKDIRAALRACGIQATPHQLRHSFATLELAATHGAGLHAVSRLLGHSSVAVTERYVASYDQDAWDAIRLLPDPRR